MSLISALNTGAAGLDANSSDLAVIGDNIANANTVGFKAGRASFSEAIAQGMMGMQRGLGVRLQGVQKILTQGALMNTAITTDLAVQGSGYFVVKGSHAGAEGNYFTRAGQFTVDKQGYLVNLDGMRVQGYTANGAGSINTAALGDLLVGSASSEARGTTSLSVRANLSADAPVPPAWDVDDAANTSNTSTSMTVYDSLGRAHDVTLYFRKDTLGSWEFHAVTDGGNVGGTPGQPTEIASGTLTFDNQGRLTDATTAVNNFTPTGAISPQPLTFNFGTPVPAGTGVDGLTQFASPSAVSFQSQDGYPPGDLTRISIDPQGQVLGAFSNGISRPIGQVALATFEAPSQLLRAGANLYTASSGTGAPTIGPPSTADRGSIVAGALEQSNVDMAQEFVRMIAAQRGFQANSKTLTTADQLLQELMTIKR
jgi:flagellar hook protein FlgE